MKCNKCNEDKGYIDFNKHKDFCNYCIQKYGLQNLALHDSYITGLLRKVNLPLTSEMIELKRQQIKLQRLIKNKKL